MSTDHQNDVFELLKPELAHALRRLGYIRPTSIQSIAIPMILNTTYNIVISAPTGSGKTEAALIPILNDIISKGCVEGRTRVIYVTPLRALNRDLMHRIERIASAIGISTGIWHGDTTYSERRKLIRRPPTILITTPESLQILLVNQGMRSGLSDVSYIVIDEAQDLASSERGAELAVAIRRLEKLCGRRIRKIMITAIPSNLEAIASFFCYEEPFMVAMSHHVKPMEIEVYVPPTSYEVDTVRSWLLGVKELADIVEKVVMQGKQVLIFANTRDAVEELGYRLREEFRRRGLDAYTISVYHSSLSRDIREDMERKFRSGEIRVLVATSSLELGIDIGKVDLVVQYLSPRQALRLIQRVGRAGHREWEKSRGVVFIPRIVSDLLESAVIARRTLARELESIPLHSKPLDVALHQVVGLALEKEEWCTDIMSIWSVLRSTYPFSDLSLHELESIITFAQELGLVRVEGDKICATKRGALYYLTTTMIVEGLQCKARSVVDDSVIAMLDEDFVASCDEGDVIVLGGRPWKVVAIDIDQNEILLEPITHPSEVRLPKWIGETIPVDRKVSREMCSLIRRLCECKDEACVNRVLNIYPLSSDAKSFIIENLDRICKIHPSDRKVVVEIARILDSTYVAIYTCAGTRGSEAIAHLLLTLCNEVLGIAPGYRAHQIAVVLEHKALDKDTVIRLLRAAAKLDEYEIEQMIIKSIENSPIMRWKLLHVAKKMGIVSKDASLKDALQILKALRGTIAYKEALREIFTDKLDIQAAKDFVFRLRKYGVKIYVSTKPSVFLEEILSLAGIVRRIELSTIPRETLISLLARKYLSKKLYAVCTQCLTDFIVDLSKLVSSLDEDLCLKPLECPRCGSRAIALVETAEDVSIVKRAIEKQKQGADITEFTEDEKRLLRKAMKIASLVMDYGVAVAVALTGRGIGADTITKILRDRSFCEARSLLMKMFETEKQFLRTYRYWHK